MDHKTAIKNTLTGALMSALVLCCFFTGGFSWELCLIPSSILTVCMALTLYTGKTNTYSAIISISLLVLSFVSVFFTLGDTQSSYYEAQKIILFVSAFYTASVCDIKVTFSKTLSYLAASVAVIGFLAYSNILRLNELVFVDSYIPRLQSVIKYANTTAVFLSMGYTACLSSYKASGKRIYILLSATILPAIYLTLSKAMIPIFMLVGTAYVFFEKDLREVFIKQNIISAMFSASVIYLASKHVYSLCFILLCLMIAVSYKLSFGKSKNLYKLWIILLLIGFIAACAILVIRFDSFTTLTGRLIYAKDSLRLLFRNPVSGCGQGSWQYLQYGIQSRGYTVRYIHNSYLQYAVENGLLFTSLMLLVFAYSFVISLKRKDYGICATLLLTYIHSFIDFDISFGIILLVLGILCGSGFNAEKLPECKKFSRIIVTLSVLICMSTCIYSAIEFVVRDSFEKAYMAKNYEKAEKYNNQLVTLCPNDPQVYINRASLTLVKTDAVTESVENDLEKAISLSPNDHKVLREYIRILSDGKNIEELTHKYLNLCPMQEDTYTFLQETIKKLLDKKEISVKKYNEILSYAENMRIKNNVADRNSLLREKFGQ